MQFYNDISVYLGSSGVTSGFFSVVFLSVFLASSAVANSSSSDIEPTLFFTNTLGISSLNLTSLNAVNLYENGHNVIDIDALWTTDNTAQLFWSDYQVGAIYTGTFYEQRLIDVRPQVDRGLAYVEGVAMDWVARNLYWVDSGYDWIEMIALDSDYRCVVISNLGSPRALVLDSRDGWMFWTDWTQGSSKIERSTLSGRKRSLIVDVASVSNGGFPNGLAIDYSTRRLYWVDAKSDSIHSTDYFGNHHVHHLANHEAVQFPFGLAFFDEHLYWVDAKLNTINKMRVTDEGNVSVLYETYQSLYGVALLHPDLHPSPLKQLPNRCLNRCSHICVLEDAGGESCLCPHWMILDGGHCVRLGKLLLVGEKQKKGSVVVFGLDPATLAPVTLPLLLSSDTDIIDLDLDPHDGNRVYWADGHDSTIWRSSFDNDYKERLFDVSVIGTLTSFAADWSNGTLFYSVNGRGIFSCSLALYTCKCIFATDNDVYGLHVVTSLKKLVWIEDDGESGSRFIRSTTTKGTSDVIIYRPVDSNWNGTALTVDDNGIVCWLTKSSVFKFHLGSGELDVTENEIGYADSLAAAEGEILWAKDGRLPGFNVSGKVSVIKLVGVGSSSESGVKVTTTTVPKQESDSQNYSANYCPLVCRNGGVCQENRCICPIGYSGRLCQLNLCDQYCVRGNCLFDEQSDRPYCICPNGYYGSRCQASLCADFCQHGVCTVIDGKPICTCSNGWSGITCSQKDEQLIKAELCDQMEPCIRCDVEVTSSGCAADDKDHCFPALIGMACLMAILGMALVLTGLSICFRKTVKHQRRRRFDLCEYPVKKDGNGNSINSCLLSESSVLSSVKLSDVTETSTEDRNGS